MADSERVILNHYNLTTLYPAEWPQEKDEDGEAEEVSTTSKDKTREKYKSRYVNLERGPTLRSSVPGSQRSRDGKENLVQKDEPDPLGTSQSVVQVLRYRGLQVEDDLKLRNQFLLSSTTFSPSRYLSEVHRDASNDDLLNGLDFLSKSIEKKSASLKVLVESNFERFVRAKATIDNVYKEMRNHGAGSEAERSSHSRQTSRNLTHWRSLSGTLSTTSATSKVPANDKRKNALIKDSEYGVQGIKTPLIEAAVKAEEVWGPALGGREREESLKSVLASIENNRPVFETGVSIEEDIKNRDYETLAEDYARAQRYVQEVKTLADRAKQNQTRLTDAQVHQIIITSRVWMDIQHRIETFKRDIWSILVSDHSGASTTTNEQTDEYMELISVLLRLGTEDNPITAWLQSRHDHLISKISSTFERVRIELEISRRRLGNGSKPSAKVLASHLKTANAIGRQNDLNTLDTPQVVRFWENICESLSLLLSTSEDGLLGQVIDYLETSQSFVDGKKQKSLPTAIDGQSRKHHKLSDEEKLRLQKSPLALFGMFREQLHGIFVEAPIEDISELFSPAPATPNTPQSASLTPSSRTKFNFRPEDLPPLSPKVGEAWEKFAFWPPYGNALGASTCLGKLLSTIAIAAGEIASIELVKQDTGLVAQLRNLVGDVRERSITATCAAWLSDSENARELEDWTRSSEKKDLTNMPSYFTALESSMLSNLQKIVYITDASSGPGSRSVVLPPPQRHIETVQKTFRNSLYKAFSGMMEHAGKPVQENGNSTEDEDNLAAPASGNQNLQIRGDYFDASDVNVRKLLTMSNFQALRNEVVPNLISQFESNFTLTIGDDAKTARDVLAQMNARVFKAYVRSTVETLEGIISMGILDPQYAPPNAARPSDAKPYVYDVLLTLVLVHTQVSRTAPSLTSQVLSYLLEQISSCLIDNFQKRKESYTLTALIQATLDVEYMAQTLNSYTTDKASEIQGKIYLALDERTDNDARLNLQKELPEMRAVLKRLREGTKGEFACFRRERKKDKDKDKDRVKS